MGRRISGVEREEIVEYHKEQLKLNPTHKQSATIRHFADRFPIAKSSLVRWLNIDQQFERPTKIRKLNANQQGQDDEVDREIITKKKISEPGRGNINSNGIANSLSENENLSNHSISDHIIKHDSTAREDNLPRDHQSQEPKVPESSPNNVPTAKSPSIENKSPKKYNEPSTINNDTINDENNLIKITSTIIQYYAELKLNNKNLTMSKEFINELVYKIKQIYPNILIPNISEILLKLNNIEYIDKLIEHQWEIKETCNKLSKETFRYRKLFNPYNNANIYQYREFTLDITELILIVDPDFNAKRLFITMGIGFNLTGDDFLKPLIINNFVKSTNENGLNFNLTGLNSYYIFNNYLHELNISLQNKILLILDKNSNNFLINDFKNIEIIYTNLPISPMDFGIENLFIKNFQINVIQQLLENFKIVMIPSIFQISYNELIFKFLNHSLYRKFLMHSINMVFNKYMRTNYRKYPRVNLIPDLKLRDRIYLLNINEIFIKEKLKLINKTNIYNDLETIIIPQYDLETIIKSNFKFEHSKLINLNNDDFKHKFKMIFDLRSSLQFNSVTEDTLRFFDLFYSSLSSNLLGVNDEYEYYEVDDDEDENAVPIKEEDEEMQLDTFVHQGADEGEEQEVTQHTAEQTHEEEQDEEQDKGEDKALHREESNDDEDIFEDAVSDNEVNYSISSQQAENQISNISQQVNFKSIKSTDFSDSELDSDESEIINFKRQELKSQELLDPLPMNKINSSNNNSSIYKLQLNKTNSLIELKSNNNSPLSNTPSQILNELNDSIDLDKQIQVPSSPNNENILNNNRANNEEQIRSDEEKASEQVNEKKKPKNDNDNKDKDAVDTEINGVAESESEITDAQVRQPESIDEKESVIRLEETDDNEGENKISQNEVDTQNGTPSSAIEREQLGKTNVESDEETEARKRRRLEKRERKTRREQRRTERKQRREKKKEKKKLRADSPGFDISQQIAFSQSQFINSGEQSIPKTSLATSSDSSTSQSQSQSQSHPKSQLSNESMASQKLKRSRKSEVEIELERLENKEDKSSYSEMDYDNEDEDEDF